ncbi:type IV secretory system conjugative DNA transfer family protein [Pseudonocardia sp. EC080619-01]|uniref:type IV secretory system conjugative DNA transfer family protein n=1 Tax=Pseudonocardia sp. EC080619-01 TaxID=1096856 RepID=UPI000A414AA4|nr:type IV secretory system conjugative DNA transfer family protein [Pseudonocardia sp. EC080619-01]
MRLAAAATRPSVTTEVSHPGARGVLAPGRVERLPVRRCGTWLGRSVVGPVIGTDCYAPHRDVIGLVAPPQTGKTALMGHHILDHDGPLVATSTKPDLYNYCAGRRAEQGPVWLFNPEQLGDMGSSVWWSPVSGCADPQIAAVRAGLLVGGVSASENGGDRWDQWSVSVLTALLMAADLSGRDMTTVARWVFSPTSDARSGGAGQALEVLGRNPDGRVPEGTVDALRQVLATDARKTRDSIFMTLSEAVKFMTDPQVAALVTGSGGGQELDAEQLVSGRGSLFVVGSDREHASIAPLLAAMTGHLFETAKRVASSRPKGRLDPPLGLFLDEAALITPVPLDRWVADAGGRGIHIEWAVQSPSQLAQRWGAKGGETIWNATNAKLIFGGLSLREDLEKASVLCGDRHEPVPTGGGEERYEKVRVCPVDRVRTIPQWHALLIHRATPATVVRISPVWERSDLRPPPAIIAQGPGAARVAVTPAVQGPDQPPPPCR